MTDLTIIKHNGGAYIDSREVAEVIGKRHDHLLRDIGKYREIMLKSIAPNFGGNDFFLESTYTDSIGRTLPCYLLSKMGCEMVANKLTGEKGVLFTAAYVMKFNELEMRERTALGAATAMPPPRLGEYNAAARLIISALKCAGTEPRQILELVKRLYEPIGICMSVQMQQEARLFTAKEIAEAHGILSISGKPHCQAVSAIINDHLFVDKSHITVSTQDYGDHVCVSVRYDEHVLSAVWTWLLENGMPNELRCDKRNYYIKYNFEDIEYDYFDDYFDDEPSAR